MEQETADTSLKTESCGWTFIPHASSCHSDRERVCDGLKTLELEAQLLHHQREQKKNEHKG